MAGAVILQLLPSLSRADASLKKHHCFLAFKLTFAACSMHNDVIELHRTAQGLHRDKVHIITSMAARLSAAE